MAVVECWRTRLLLDPFVDVKLSALIRDLMMDSAFAVSSRVAESQLLPACVKLLMEPDVRGVAGNRKIEELEIEVRCCHSCSSM